MPKTFQPITEIQKQCFSQLQSGEKKFGYYSLHKLGKHLNLNLDALPVSLRIVLESVLRNADGQKITDEDIKRTASWSASKPSMDEIPFTVARIVLQDFTGVPLLVDLAAMRSAMERIGGDASAIEPLVPVDLVIDHSVQVDFAGNDEAFKKNIQREFERNRERYEFLKWGQQAFDGLSVVPPGIGIVHQVNLEYLAQGVLENNGVIYPDSLVGTDSHTTMINGLGVVGWGVGGIEAEAGMLGQPIYFLSPEIVGMELTGELKEGVTATDMTLTITQILREAKVVGKFVEFHGAGAEKLPLADRATISNMAPEYGATMGYFPVDEESCRYLENTGRPSEKVQLLRDYLQAQNLFGIPQGGEKQYTQTIQLDLASIEPSVAGPKRPQDRIVMKDLGKKFTSLIGVDRNEGGFGLSSDALKESYPVESGIAKGEKIGHGSILIAAITSCTNTSNPTVMVAAGLLAKKAVEYGLQVNPLVKASLAPGSRVVSDYLEKADLQKYLDTLGFNLVGYGCTTCIGNSGPLDESIEKLIVDKNLVGASVLSGNRNFEARVHPNIKANFLMSPPLVVAYALKGNICCDLSQDPIGQGKNGENIYLQDLWPSQEEIREVIAKALQPESFRRLYKDFDEQNPDWKKIETSTGEIYDWKAESTYIQEPPFFEGFRKTPPPVDGIKDARALLVLSDSVTTDHISPAGSFSPTSPAGQYLIEQGVEPRDFNSYGSRRGNDKVMTRGSFANVRIKNLMVDGVEGGFTKINGEGDICSVFEAAEHYKKENTPLVVFGGKEYGTGSSRDWAAKGTLLLGVRAVICESFERIHRSNLVGMGVLPLCFKEGDTVKTLGLDGTETYSLSGLEGGLKVRQEVELEITKKGETRRVPLTVRLDTPVELEYYKHGGILPYVLRELAGE